MLDYSKILSDTVQDIKPSGIRKFFDLLAEKAILPPLVTSLIAPIVSIALIVFLKKSKDL